MTIIYPYKHETGLKVFIFLKRNAWIFFLRIKFYVWLFSYVKRNLRQRGEKDNLILYINELPNQLIIYFVDKPK